jgi:hypothetical protein
MQELDQAVQDAADQRDEAERVSLSLQREASESQSSSTVQDLVVLEESRTGRVLQGVGVAAVAGLLVGVAALVLPDLLHRRREPSPDAPAGSVRSRPTLATGARDAS